MNRIEQRFSLLRRQKKCAFIAFVTAGYPGLSHTEQLARAFDSAGVDILELGVPFTDPMADGPVIQAASQAALARGVTLAKILETVRRIRRHSQMPIALMTYYNPVFSFGLKRFVAQAVRAGVDGVIIPDLPPEESKELRRAARQVSLDVIAFVAPTSTPSRMRQAAQAASGFIYYVSLTGVTGARRSLPKELTGKVAQLKCLTKKPVCIGFGVSDRSQVAQLSRVADGVIVGSAIMRMVTRYAARRDMAARVASYVTSLKG